MKKLIAISLLLGGCSIMGSSPDQVKTAQDIIAEIAKAVQAYCAVVPPPAQLASLAADTKGDKAAALTVAQQYCILLQQATQPPIGE